MEITGCSAASTAGHSQGLERIPAAYMQSKNLLLHPGQQGEKPDGPVCSSCEDVCATELLLSSRDVSPLSLSSSQEQGARKEDTAQCVEHCCAQGSKRGCACRKL